MQKKVCEFHVAWPWDVYKHLTEYLRSNSYIKRKLMEALNKLYKKGYRHIIIDIVEVADFWIAELLYKLKKANPEWDLKYTLRFYQQCQDDFSNPWIEDYPWDYKAVINGAHRIIYKTEYYENRIGMEAVNFNEMAVLCFNNYRDAEEFNKKK